MKIEEIITDEQLSNAWGNASFGEISKREVVRCALLKYACGYSTGHTAMLILQELGLLTRKENLTTSGKQYLFEACSNGNSL